MLEKLKIAQCEKVKECIHDQFDSIVQVQLKKMKVPQFGDPNESGEKDQESIDEQQEIYQYISDLIIRDKIDEYEQIVNHYF